MVAQSSSIARPIVSDRSHAIVQGLLAMLFGVLVIGVVGFSHIDVVHNAAHDVRHSSAFPCH